MVCTNIYTGVVVAKSLAQYETEGNTIQYTYKVVVVVGLSTQYPKYRILCSSCTYYFYQSLLLGRRRNVVAFFLLLLSLTGIVVVFYQTQINQMQHCVFIYIKIKDMYILYSSLHVHVTYCTK